MEKVEKTNPDVKCHTGARQDEQDPEVLLDVLLMRVMPGSCYNHQRRIRY